MKLKSFHTVVFVIIFALPQSSGAWFEANKEPHSFSRKTASNSFKSPEILVFYDDTTHGEDRILMPRNDFFIPVDTVNLDIPLIFLSQTPVSPMDALDRLMAANLKMKLLIDEYNALQKKADELLKSVFIPYLDAPWQSWDKSSDKTNTNSLYEQKRHLETKFNGVLLQGHALNRGKSVSINSSAIGLQARGGGQSKMSTKNTNYINGSTMADRTQGLSQDISSTPTVSNEKELPWIFAFFITATSYCLSHRLEAVLYGVGLFLFVYLITLQARHGK